MHRRLIVAFIVVALLAALASQWVTSLLLPAFPSLHVLVTPPGWALHSVSQQSLPGSGTHRQVRPLLITAFCLAAALFLLAVITGLSLAASRLALLPVRRLALVAQRTSGGDLPVRIQTRGRDEIAELVTSFKMASALEDKVSELEQMKARARQFAGHVSHELRTPLTAMTAVVGILHEHPALTGDAAAAAQLVQQEVRHLTGWPGTSSRSPASTPAPRSL